MGDPTKIIGLIVGLFALLAIVGVVIVYLKGTVADGTIASLERSVAAYKTELDAQRVEFAGETKKKDTVIADQDKRLTACELKSKEQGRTIDILKGVITNADEVKAISILLTEHHDSSMSILKKMESSLERVIIREGDRHGNATDV